MASPARVVAIDVLLKIAKHPDTFTAETLTDGLTQAKLSDADSRLATSLVYNTLRRGRWLDQQYAPHLTSNAKLTEPVKWLLRMAACQKYLMERVPAHAISHETTDLAKMHLKLHKGHVHLVHAVVRRILETEAPVNTAYDSAQEILELNHGFGKDVADILTRYFGEDDALKVAAAQDDEPEICLRNNGMMGERDQLSAALNAQSFGFTAGRFSAECLYLVEGSLRDLLRTEEFRAGRFYIQDESSQLVALIADVKPGWRVLDYCAAPGGKTTHLMEVAEGRITMVATDSSGDRLEKLRENLDRLRTPFVDVKPLYELEARGDFDLVLVDAPCSGLGTMRHNPEVRWRVDWPQVERLSQLQFNILSDAAQHVRPGGVLLYSTCTVTRKENEVTVNRFLAAFPDFSIDKTARIPELGGAEGLYKTWPAYTNMDGFFVARMVRGGID